MSSTYDSSQTGKTIALVCAIVSFICSVLLFILKYGKKEAKREKERLAKVDPADQNQTTSTVGDLEMNTAGAKTDVQLHKTVVEPENEEETYGSWTVGGNVDVPHGIPVEHSSPTYWAPQTPNAQGGPQRYYAQRLEQHQTRYMPYSHAYTPVDHRMH